MNCARVGWDHGTRSIERNHGDVEGRSSGDRDRGGCDGKVRGRRRGWTRAAAAATVENQHTASQSQRKTQPLHRPTSGRRELEEEIKAAKEVGADWDINPRMAELEHIEEYLRTETWKGRSRKFSNDEEKARLAVKKAIDRALDKIAIKAPKAGTHLTATIQTGTSATYADITTLWKL